MDNELTFSGDCVLRLQDLGDFKDYSDTVDELKSKLAIIIQTKINKAPDILWEVISADPEDTFFLPAFQIILKQIIQINWTTFDLSQEQQFKILQFYFQVLEECFLSFTFGQQVIENLIKKLQSNEYKGDDLQKLIFKLLFKLSDKVMFIEQLELMGRLWRCLDQEGLFSIFSTPQDKDKAAAVYSECCEKFLRDRKLRQILWQDSKKPFLRAKISLWKREKDIFHNCLQQVRTKQFYKSDFLQSMCQWLQNNLSKM